MQRIVFRDNAAILERMEGRQIIVKEEIEQEIKDQPVAGSFASREKSLASNGLFAGKHGQVFGAG